MIPYVPILELNRRWAARLGVGRVDLFCAYCDLRDAFDLERSARRRS